MRVWFLRLPAAYCCLLLLYCYGIAAAAKHHVNHRRDAITSSLYSSSNAHTVSSFESTVSSFSSASRRMNEKKLSTYSFFSSGRMDGVENVLDYGAVGDGVTDDSSAIQKAVDVCRDGSSTRACTVYFPPGMYATNSPIDFTNWQSFSIIGGNSGASAIGGNVGVSLLTRVSKTVAFDFSGSSYGYVSGIAFGIDTSAALPSPLLLLARMKDNSANHSTYGSDIVFEGCNIGGFVGIASVILHSSEVVTWINCRFASNTHTPSLIYTCDQKTWGYESVFQPGNLIPFTSCSQTAGRVIGGEFADAYSGQEGPFILIDSPPWGSQDFFFHDLYIGCGPNTHFIEVRGGVVNVYVSNIRFENILMPGQPSGGVWSLIHLNDGQVTLLKIEAVNFANAAEVISIGSNHNSTVAIGHATISASNTQSVYAGGSFIEYMVPLFAVGSVSYQLPTFNGKFAASFSGNFLEFYVSATGYGQAGSSIQYTVTSVYNNTNSGQGSVFFGDQHCNSQPASQATFLCASHANNSDWFIVRRLM